MDITFLQTFLEVARTRHFGRAAGNLFITQSAVSARIKHLEDTLGVELFIRKRNDIHLTVAGAKLQKHAETIVGAWRGARQDVATGAELERVLTVGFPVDMWSIGLRERMASVVDQVPDLGLDLQVHAQSDLGERVARGALDLAVLFDPPQLPGLEITPLFDVNIVLYCTRAGVTLEEALQGTYVHVDWGTNFSMQSTSVVANRASNRLRANAGSLARDYLLDQGGSAYLVERMVEHGAAAAALHRVADAPGFARTVFAIYKAGHPDVSRFRQVIMRVGA